ncbi:MAG TPA: MFS transporter [Solirubrobacteraceae bacterium]|nr:MFS transporter [Solirubrobacteraceae bacterium]
MDTEAAVEHLARAVEISESRFRRWSIPRPISFWISGAVAFLAFAANAAASPLYALYQAQFRFTAVTLTILFAVYVLALVVTLLFIGSLSDYVGRRRVIIVGLAASVIACVMFLLADGIGLLFAARALQGVGVGLLSGAAGAALLELRPKGRIAPLVASAAPTGGQALGALGASVLAQYAPLPTHLVWWLLLAAFIAAILAVWKVPEPGTLRPGALASLRPRASVPPQVRGAFAAALPCLVGVWALGGLYLSLGPSLAAQLTHSHNLLWGGVLIFLLTGLGAKVSAAFQKSDPSRVMLGGCVALSVGAVVTWAAINTNTAWVLFVGTGVAGSGFGPAFSGAYRSVVSLAPPRDRAGVITAVYIVCYVATAVPAVAGGIATSVYGLHETALVYSVAVAALAAAAVAASLHRLRGVADPKRKARDADTPPGPCTVPPCFPPTRRPRAVGQ